MSTDSVARAVPTSSSDITPEWLSSALTGDDGPVSISAIDVEPIGVGLGIMSLLFRLTPNYESGSGPRSLVAKIAPPYEQVRMIAAGYRFYATEVAMYRNLRSELGLRPPALYYADHDPDSDEFVILMEDLGHLRTCDQLEGCGIDDAHHHPPTGSPSRSLVAGPSTRRAVHREIQPGALPAVERHGRRTVLADCQRTIRSPHT
jgi:hypothetical protein